MPIAQSDALGIHGKGYIFSYKADMEDKFNSEIYYSISLNIAKYRQKMVPKRSVLCI